MRKRTQNKDEIVKMIKAAGAEFEKMSDEDRKFDRKIRLKNFIKQHASKPGYVQNPAKYIRYNFRHKCEYIRCATNSDLSNRTIERYLVGDHYNCDRDDNGVIYVITNKSIPEYVKIGYTHDMKHRLKELNHSTCAPLPFETYKLYVADHELEDKKIHAILDKHIPDKRAVSTFNGKKRVREFYKISAEEACELIEKYIIN